MKTKKGQMGIDGAPVVVLLVGLTFLVMATIALVGEKFNDSFPADNAGTGINEAATKTQISAGYPLSGSYQENAQRFVLSSVRNTTGAVGNGNFTLSNTGLLRNASSLEKFGTAYQVNYTYYYSGTAANVTTDMLTEIENNTSIAGIVLTISLVGIVLTVLMGVFLGLRARRI